MIFVAWARFCLAIFSLLGSAFAQSLRSAFAGVYSASSSWSTFTFISSDFCFKKSLRDWGKSFLRNPSKMTGISCSTLPTSLQNAFVFLTSFSNSSISVSLCFDFGDSASKASFFLRSSSAFCSGVLPLAAFFASGAVGCPPCPALPAAPELEASAILA